MAQVSDKLLFIGVLLCFVLKFVKCQQYEGDICTLGTSGQQGTCKVISACPSAIQMLQVQKIPPQTCGFKGAQPIVCCTEAKANTPSQPDNTPRLTPVTNASPSVTSATRATVPTPKPTPKPTPAPVLRVGDKARAKCIEYEKYAYIYATLGGAPSLDCVIHGVQQIVGGEEAKLKEFPHMALIGYVGEGGRDDIKWQCGGSLISEYYILTAAHCLAHPTYGDAEFVRIGDLDISTDEDEAEPQDLTVVERIPHPEYSLPAKYHDIALLKLNRKARLNNYARPICLETSHDIDITVKPSTSGWGAIGWLASTSSKLMKVNLEYFSHEACYKTYKRDIGKSLPNGIIDNGQVCAGSYKEAKDACQGDSGGPLQVVNTDRVCMYNLVGITSFGKGCGFPGVPGVYTRVSNYIEWIERIVWP